MSERHGKKSETKELSAPISAGRPVDDKMDIREKLAIRSPKLLAEFDAMFAAMQTPEAKAGILKVARMTPEELGQAAVKAAKSKAL